MRRKRGRIKPADNTLGECLGLGLQCSNAAQHEAASERIQTKAHRTHAFRRAAAPVTLRVSHIPDADAFYRKRSALSGLRARATMAEDNALPAERQMKAVMANVPEHILEWRRRTGADQWDEMWEGVLHMAPSPNRDHQDFEFASGLCGCDLNWASPNGCRVYHQINIVENRAPGPTITGFPIWCCSRRRGSTSTATSTSTAGRMRSSKFTAQATKPTRSSISTPKSGVREVWIIDRDTKRPEILELVGGEYQARQPDADGWVRQRRGRRRNACGGRRQAGDPDCRSSGHAGADCHENDLCRHSADEARCRAAGARRGST